MTAEQFDQQIKRLSDTYGAQHYKQERLTLLWRRVKDFPYQWLERTVDSLLASHRQAPMIADFEEAISAERERAWKREKGTNVYEIRPGGYACTTCKDTGVYVCLHREMSGFWAFRCHCPKGERDPRTQIPFYTDEHKKQGFVFAEMPTYGKGGT